MMHIQTLQENLLSCLSKASRIIQQKTQLPILDNIIIQAQGGIITVCVSNLEIAEKIQVKGKILQEGSVLVSEKLLLEYVSSLPPETVELKRQDLSLVVTCKKMKAVLPGVAPEEYPLMPEKTGKEIHIPKEELMRSLETVLFSASTDEARPALTGVRIVKKDKLFEVVTTDGYRLTKTEAQFPFEESLLLPAKALKEVVRFGKEEKELEDILVSQATNGYTCFSIGETQVFTKKIESDYPSYERIIPNKHTTSVTVETEELRRVVRSVAIFAKDNANIIKWRITEETLFVSSQSGQSGEGEAEITIKKEGEDAEISFNSRFLLDFLSNYKEDEMIFEMTGALNPGAFMSLINKTFLHIIMPVRTGSS